MVIAATLSTLGWLMTILLRHRPLRAATLCAVVLLWSVCATSVAAEKAMWGPTTLPDGRSAFPVYEELGVDTLQVQLHWSQVAPTRPASPADPDDPAYQWPVDLARSASEADRHGIRLALQLLESPRWANGDRPSIWAPQDAGDFADFATAAARRYPYVRRWMIWGEPNKANRFQPNRSNDPIGPRAYAPLLDAAYGALKRASSRNVVIGGMTWTGGEVRPPDFVRFMRLGNGRPPRLDWFGHNPFPFRFPDLKNGPAPGGYRDMSDLDTFGREVDRAYARPEGRPVRFWLSEYVIQSDRGSDFFATFVSRADQARWLTAAYDIADRATTRVAGLGWVSLVDEPPAPGSPNWGLLTHELERKPAFDAYARAPSERRRPVVRVAARTSRSVLAGRGLLVRIDNRDSGTVTLELRRRGTVYDRARLSVGGTRRLVRVRHRGARAGRYTVVVRSSFGSTLDRVVTVR